MSNIGKSSDVTIVGAGIIGICSALSLLERGYSVEIIDRNEPASGASHGNAGVISPWSCIPQSVPGVWRKVPGMLLDPKGPLTVRWGHAPRFLPWALRFLKAGRADRIDAVSDAMYALQRGNVDLYRRHLEGTGDENLVRNSNYLFVYRDPAMIEKGDLAWRLREKRGARQDVVDAATLRDMEPALSSDYKAGIVVEGQARALDPGGIGRALMAKAQSKRARFHRLDVHAIQPGDGGGWRLRTAAGERQANKIVLAAGAWSARLLAPLGVKLPLEAERGYHLMLRNPRISVNNSIMDVAGKFVASSMTGGLRCAGTAEFAGLDAPPDYRRARLFKGLAKSLFPDLHADEGQEWMGIRPSFPDSLPCIGEVPGHPGLIAAFGHSHYGLGMAPTTGQLVAQMVAGEPPNVDVTPYRCDRFA